MITAILQLNLFSTLYFSHSFSSDKQIHCLNPHNPQILQNDQQKNRSVGTGKENFILTACILDIAMMVANLIHTSLIVITAKVPEAMIF